MSSFMPEGDKHLLMLIEAALTPLLILSACAGAVWGLQGDYASVVKALRLLMDEHRDDRTPTRKAVFAQVLVLVRRARLLRSCVAGFYLTMLLQMLSTVWMGLLVLGVVSRPDLALVFFGLSLFVLAIVLLLTLADTYLSYRYAEAEAREAGLLPTKRRGR